MKPALFLIILFLIFVEFLFLLFFVSNPVLAKTNNSVNIAVTIDEHLSYSVENDLKGNKLNVSTNSQNGFMVISIDDNLTDYSSGPSQKSYELNSNNFIIVTNY